MVKIKIVAKPDYVMGYLKYGHFEGEVELTEEEFKKLQNDPERAFNELDLGSACELIVDSYEIEDYGDIGQVSCEVIED